MIWYHGGNEQLNFNGTNLKGSHSVNTGLWLTDNFDAAVSYMHKPNPCVAEIKVKNLNKTLTIDFKGNSWSSLPELSEEFKGCKITDDLVRKAKSLGYDSLMFKNCKDAKGAFYGWNDKKFDLKKALKPSTTLVVTRPDQIAIVGKHSPDDIEDIKESYFDY